MVPFAYFGIKSSTLSLIVDLLIVFVAVLYVALIYWTVNDARRRIGDPLLVGCAFLAALFPFIGPVVYMVLRPPEYLADAREREVETRAAEVRLAQLATELCQHCDYPIERDFLRCPSCLRKLKEPCSACARPLDPAWSICPYCETEVPGAAASRSRSRRRPRAEQREAEQPPESAIQSPPRGRRPRRQTPSPRASGRDSKLDAETIALPDVALVDEPPLRTEDLLGQTMESDLLPDSPDDDPARLPATEPGSRSRDASRRARRPRPGS